MFQWSALKIGHMQNHTRRDLFDGSTLHTLSLKSLSLLLSVCYKTTQTTGGVGVAGAYPPTSKLGTFLLWSLALSMPI